MRITLLDLNSPGARAIEADTGEIDVCYIGTSEICAVRLPKASYTALGRREVLLRWTGDGVRLEYLKGTNPCRLDGEAFTSGPVGPDEHVLELGDYRFNLIVRR